MTSGLVLTIWLGVGAQIYNPPIKGHVPPPMTIAHCPYKNLSLSLNDTVSSMYADATSTSSSFFPDVSTPATSPFIAANQYVLIDSCYTLTLSLSLSLSLSIIYLHHVKVAEFYDTGTATSCNTNTMIK
jgi:hypothetical protein